MKKKIIPATLISIICIGIVCAAINFDNLHEEGSLHTEKGWNLIYGFFNPEEQLSANSDISADDIEAVYAYIPTTNEYARAYPEPEVEKLRQIDDDELLNTAFWVYSDKSGTIVYEIYDNSYIPFDERPLYQGWNFLGLMPEMKMKKLSELRNLQY
ncbi:MAG: hypothetical protein KJ858_04055 [Nanoarchaeota archaeon]|nr:hypothetical protein [Nanoarchaeota archaeon]